MAQEPYDGMLARCRALQLFLEVAVVDDDRVLELFARAGQPSPKSLLKDVRERFDVDGRGLRYEQFQSFLRVAALSRSGSLSKEAATKALLADLTKGLGYEGSALPTPDDSASSLAAAPRIDMGFAIGAEQGKDLAAAPASSPVDDAAEAVLDGKLKRVFVQACDVPADGKVEMQSYQFYRLILSTRSLSSGTAKVAAKEADAIFSSVRGFKTGVEFDGFQECLRQVAVKVYPDLSPVVAHITLKKHIVDFIG
jgi:hypothetical protein